MDGAQLALPRSVELSYPCCMRAVMLEVPEHWLEERRRTGADRRDEVWDGVLHMVPQPTSGLLFRQRDLLLALGPIAARHGLEVVFEISVFDPVRGEKNYRVPDVAVFAPASVSARGLEGHAELVIEVLSPGDESRAKLPFFAMCGIPEVWLLHPSTRAAEVYTLAEGAYVLVPAVRGVISAPRLGLELETVEGPKLRIRSGELSFDV
jgi:Uma2 family endonuclease